MPDVDRGCATHFPGCDCHEREFDRQKAENERLREALREALRIAMEGLVIIATRGIDPMAGQHG